MGFLPLGLSCLKGFVNPSLEGRRLHFSVLHKPGSWSDGEVSAAGSAPMAQLEVAACCALLYPASSGNCGVAALKSLMIEFVFEKLL